MSQNSQYSALVIGSSGSIGSAVFSYLQETRGPQHVMGLSRRHHGFDITDEASIASAARHFKQSDQQFDLIFDATGILEVDGTRPEKSFDELTTATMTKAYLVNTIGPALLFKHFMPLLVPKERSVFATLSARVGSIGDNRLGGWMSYRASKAALNQIVRCAAIEAKRHSKNSIVVALHPGTIESELTRKYAKGRYTATADESAANLLNVLSSLSENDTGSFFDYAGKPIIW